jgi:hypothetical protein
VLFSLFLSLPSNYDFYDMDNHLAC